MQIYSPTLSGSTDILGPLIHSGSFTGTGNLTIAGISTAQSLVVSSITASNSTKFGALISNTHEFTGSVRISGSLTATSSFANNSTSASYALSASQAVSASNSTSASYALRSLSSFPFSGSAEITGSLSVAGTLQLNVPGVVNGYVLTTDSAGNATWQTAGAGASFPYTGNAVISGSLLVSGSGIVISGSSSVSGSGTFSDNLLVRKPTFPTITVQNTSTTSGYPTFLLKNNAIASIANGNSIGYISLVDSNNTGLAEINFYRSGSYANIILNRPGIDGYVGIGLTSPTSKLHVTGNVNLNQSIIIEQNADIKLPLLTDSSPNYIVGVDVGGGAGGKLYRVNKDSLVSGTSIVDINTGTQTGQTVIRPEYLEPSKYTTINIFNFLNFS